MPELDFVILADGVSQRPDGKLDLFGAGWDTIFAQQVPAQHGQFSIVARVLLSAHEMERDHRLALVLVGEDGDEIARTEGDVEAAAEEVRTQVPAGDRTGIGVAMTLVGLVFPRYGAYNLLILWDGNELRQAVRLKVAPPPASPE